MTLLEGDAPRTVLAVYAHPDDPEISAGGGAASATTRVRGVRARSSTNAIATAAGRKSSA